MKDIKKATAVMLAFFCVCMFSGCYTKLASYHSETAYDDERCGECHQPEREPAQTNKEICVWERDIFGYAQLRCYNSNYSSSWFYFHNTPWWYRNNHRWYDTRGCPPHYYYDRVSGTCRYYSAARPPHAGGGGSGGGGNTSSKSGPSVSRRDFTSGSSTHNNTVNDTTPPMFPSGTTKQLSPAGAPSQPSTSSNDGLSKGSGQEVKPAPEPKPQSNTESKQKPQEEKNTSRRPSRGR